MVDVVPVNVPEERMRHDLLRIRRPRPKPQLRLPGEQLLEDRNRVSRHVDRIQRLVRKNRVVDLIFILTAERRLLKEHLVDQHTERPPVHRTSVSLIQENLQER